LGLFNAIVAHVNVVVGCVAKVHVGQVRFEETALFKVSAFKVSIGQISFYKVYFAAAALLQLELFKGKLGKGGVVQFAINKIIARKP
jgi:hypothetical protein